jgi:hypothetical protein
MTLIVEELGKKIDFMRLQEPWNELLSRSHAPKIFFSWEWFHLWLKHFWHGEDFHSLLAKDGLGGLVGIVPLIVNQNPDGVAAQFIGDPNTWDYRDMIIDQTLIEPVLVFLLSYLKEKVKGDGNIELSGLSEHSLTKRCIVKPAENLGFQVQLLPEDTCPILSLPATWEAYLRLLKKKDKHELERKTRKINREAQVALYKVKDTDKIRKEMEDFFTLHRASRQEKAGFMDDEMVSYFLSIADLFIQQGRLNLSFLTANGKKIAVILGFEYLDTLYVYNSGYEPHYSSWSPGIVLMGMILQDCIQRGIKIVDFLRGNEPYKYKLGEVDNRVYKMILSV